MSALPAPTASARLPEPPQPIGVHEQNRIATLRLIGDQGGVTTRVAAFALHLTREAAAERLSRLKQRGLVVADDAPTPTYTLTSAGWEILERRDAPDGPLSLTPKHGHQVEQLVARVDREITEAARRLYAYAGEAASLRDELQSAHREAIGRSLLADSIAAIVERATPLASDGNLPERSSLGPAVRRVAKAEGVAEMRERLLDLGALCAALASDPALDEPRATPEAAPPNP